jgi:hypothetical protein
MSGFLLIELAQAMETERRREVRRVSGWSRRPVRLGPSSRLGAE